MLKRIYFAVFTMGFTALAAQTILVREFFIVFNGNELTIGIVLANWILLVALGSAIGGYAARRVRDAVSLYAFIQFAIFLYFPAAIFLIRIMKNLMGLGVGEGAGNLTILCASFIIPSLLGIPMGMRFPIACRMAGETSGKRAESTGAVYAVEAAGFIAAGPLITYILITRLNSFSTAFIMGGLTALSSVVILADRRLAARSRLLAGMSAALAVASVLLVLWPSSYINNRSLRMQWQGQNLLQYKNSIYGNLAVTERLGQYTFYSNGMPVITSPNPDTWHTEDLAHFAMASHPDPKRVLLIGGGAGGVINEILKHPVEKLTYAELDPGLIGLVRQFPSALTEMELKDPRLEIKYIDGRLLVDRMISGRARADVVIVNLPIPSTLQVNRFYTKEFFTDLRQVLGERGVLAFTMPGSLSAMSPELTDLNGSILKTAGNVLNAIVIPGYSNLFLASPVKIALTPELLLERIGKRGIATKIFNRQYIEERLGPQWTKWFDDSIALRRAARVNSDLFPAGTYYAVSYWNALFSPRSRQITGWLDRINLSILLAAVLVIGAAAFTVKGIFGLAKRYVAGFAVFTAGFTGMGLNLMIVYAYQSSHGYVFSRIALLVSAFMAGLALGGFAATRSLEEIRDGMGFLLKLEVCGAAACFAVGLFLQVRMPPLFYFALAAVPGALMGMEFPVANKIYVESGGGNESGGTLYALDLLGSWGAALLTSFALVPLVGITNTCLALAAFKTASLTLVATSRR